MTFIMLIIAHGTQTPVLMWLVAMGCDTIMVTTFMVLRAFGKF